MAPQPKTSYLRGRRIRLTRTDVAGRPVYGDANAAVSKGFVTASMTTNVEEGEAVNVTTADGSQCVFEPATPTVNGIAVEIEFCDVDFSVFELATGQEIYLDENDQPIGITESTEIDLASVTLALELWLGAQVGATAAAEGDGWYGYVLLPFLQGGVIGDISVENGAISFTVTGIQSKTGSAWGLGPYLVELVNGVRTLLRAPIKPGDYRRIFTTQVAPPEPSYGAIPVLDPSDDDLTGIDTVATGLSVEIDPTPAGTDPVWYDFGDGTWDYAETGTYTHVYEAAGTYTITARRGTSVVTDEVTVTV